ncbi:MAG TPA: immunoglobulin domain-containing protein [Holophagaceae bacterium]|nr:immunoglobulin domain-containing protein [Holophagaceae bacterium]
MFKQMIHKLWPGVGRPAGLQATLLASAMIPMLFLMACGGSSSSDSSAAPSITTQPSPVTVRSTQTATFTISVEGNPGPSIAWQKDGQNIPGANTATLILHSVSLSDAGSYRAVIQNSLGTVTSNAATLTVLPTVLFNAPAAMAVDVSGNIYVANSGDHTICKVDGNGGLAILAGASGQPGYLDGTGANARFNWPTGLALDGAGTLYVADGSNVIRTISPGGVVTTLAGAAGTAGTADGTGSTARFGALLQGLTWDGGGNLLVADTYNHTIRRITTAGVVTTVAGLPGQPGATNGAVAVATFSNPSGVAVNASGTIFVADYGNSTVRAISGGMVTTFAGVSGTKGSTDGVPTTATFNRPTGLSLDSQGRLFVADADANTIRRLETNGTVSTFAGTADAQGNYDATGADARFHRPTNLFMLAGDTLLVADTANGQIRKATSAGVVTTLVDTAP